MDKPVNVITVYNKTIHKRIPADAKYVGRPSPYGNPFVIGKDGTRDEVIEKYRAWLLAQPALVERVKHELKNKALVCWCSPKRCHAEVLAEIANPDYEVRLWP